MSTTIHTAAGVELDVERTLPIPIVLDDVADRAPAGAHGLALDEDGWEVCTGCGDDWPCEAVRERPAEPAVAARG